MLGKTFDHNVNLYHQCPAPSEKNRQAFDYFILTTQTGCLCLRQVACMATFEADEMVMISFATLRNAFHVCNGAGIVCIGCNHGHDKWRVRCLLHCIAEQSTLPHCIALHCWRHLAAGVLTVPIHDVVQLRL
jgi:hypothetical protein